MSEHHPADVNGDGVVTDEELAMHLEFKRKEARRRRCTARCDAKDGMVCFVRNAYYTLLVSFCTSLVWVRKCSKYYWRYCTHILCSYCVLLVSAFFGARCL